MGTPFRKANGADRELNTLAQRLEQLQVCPQSTQTSYMRTVGIDTISEQLQQLQFGGTSTRTSYDGRDNSLNVNSLGRPQRERAYYYLIRISPVALDGSDIQPCGHTRHNFQLRAFLGPGGTITAELTRDTSQMFVVPGNDGALIIQSLHRYMETHGGGLFLYVRMPKDQERTKEVEGHLDRLSAVLLEYTGSFEIMDVAWF